MFYNQFDEKKCFCSFPFDHKCRARRRDGEASGNEKKKRQRDIRVPELNSELALITIAQKDQLRNFGSILQAGGARAASRRVPLSHTE